jgi:hydroxypyruvate reductase
VEELGSDASAFAARRRLLRAIFTETLDAIAVRSVMQRMVNFGDGMLRITDVAYSLADFRRIIVVAIGKAAVPGAEILLQQISVCRPDDTRLQAIVVGPGEILSAACAIEQWPGSHPIPDSNSRSAARRLINLLRDTTAQDLVLFFISGGASAMVELPLDESISVEETAEFYRALVHSGLTIAEMNTLRKHLSAVKGGRLAQLAAHAAKCTLLISDVPDAMTDVIGSGPTLPDSSTCAQCWQLMRRPELKSIPQRVRDELESAELPETPKEGLECFRNAQSRVVLSTATMLSAAAKASERYGFHAAVDNTCDDWDYRDAAEYLLDRALVLGREHPRLCLLSGGEVSVQVSSESGRGGRNQQFALYCASLLRGSAHAVSVLSAGTDGVDGNSPAAGAVVDATTVERAGELQGDVHDALERFDSYPLLERIGDAIVTGPTGNNVRDLRIVMVVRNEPSQDFDETGAR